MLETAKTYGRFVLLMPAAALVSLLSVQSPAVGQTPQLTDYHGTGLVAPHLHDGIEGHDVVSESFAGPHGAACVNGTCGTSCCGGRFSDPCSRNGWYLSASGGWQRRQTVREANDHRTFLDFEDGFVANTALGYRFNRLRIEAEYSFMNNEVERAGAGGLSSSASGNVNLRALMFNLYRDFDVSLFSWKPYLGAGIGLYQSDINSLYPEFFDNPMAPAQLNGTAVNTTSDMPLAYQFRAGATRRLSDKTEFYTGYRFFRGEELEFAALPFSQFAPTFHPEGSKNHMVEFGFRVNF